MDIFIRPGQTVFQIAVVVVVFCFFFYIPPAIYGSLGCSVSLPTSSILTLEILEMCMKYRFCLSLYFPDG